MNVLADNDRLRMITLVEMLVFTTLVFLFSMFNSIPFWDMLGYAASVLSFSQSDTVSIHASVFADLRDNVSPVVYQTLTNGSDYRSVMSADPEAFSQQIPYYKIRILYVLVLWMLTKIGFGIYGAIHVASAVFSCSALLVIYFGLRFHLHSLFWMVTPIIFYGVTSNFEVIQAGGVDAFAFFWVAMTLVAYIRGHKLLLPLLVLSVLVRTDLVILAGLMFGILLLTDRSNWRKVAIWGAVTLFLYVWVNMWAGNYG